jgi:matrixin
MGLVRRVGAWRRYRRMSRQLAELDRADAQGHEPGVRRSGKVARGTVARGLLAVGAVIAIAAVLFAAGKLFPGFVSPPAGYYGGGTRGPLPGVSGQYRFIDTTPSGRPVTYSSCTPIHYVVNTTGMPREVVPLVGEAVQQVSEASGLRFVNDGGSTEQPVPDRPVYQPQRYGRGYAPVLIAWVDHAPPAETGAAAPPPGGDVDGQGGSSSLTERGQPESRHFVTGQVSLFAPGLTRLLASRDGTVKVRAIILHELGHVLGLDHVDDRNELMAPTYTGLSGFGPGDRAGLRLLGDGPCWPNP